MSTENRRFSNHAIWSPIMVCFHTRPVPGIPFEDDPHELAVWTRQVGPRILSRLGIARGMRVLDVGCGFGAWARAALRVIGPSGRLVALDCDQAALKQLRSWTADVPAQILQVVCDDAVRFLENAGEAAFDAVLLFDVLQFLRPWPRVFRLVQRVLSDVGIAAVNPGLSHHLDIAQGEDLLFAILRAGFRPTTRFTERVVHYRHFAQEELWSFRNEHAPLTPFRARVYAAIWFIPKGRVTTYAALAHHLNCRSPQAVGQALRANPFAPTVPCHRVVASDLSPGGFRGRRDIAAIRRKTTLLAEEGVRFEGGRLADPGALWKFPDSTA